MSVRFNIPIIVERVSQENEPAYYEARPLFFQEVEGRDAREARAVEQLETKLRRHLAPAFREANHEKLTRYTFHPALARHHLTLTLHLKRTTFSGKFFLASFESSIETLVYCPKAALTFVWPKMKPLEDVASLALAEWLREQERAGSTASPSNLATPGLVGLSQIELLTSVKQRLPKKTSPFGLRAELGSQVEMDGGEELERVGRCLNRRFPKELQRAVYRDEEVAALENWYETPREFRRPLVLVGPHQVGKTGILHEFLFRRLERRGPQGDRQLWLLNPQRLISGMAYVGQWEQRLLAILKHMRHRRHLLYMDEVLGFFSAGRSSQSDLTLGHLLKVEMQERPLDVIAEATPEMWRRLKERDRGFADLFQVMPVREPADRDILRTLIHVIQEMESRGARFFAPEVLPLIIQWQRRFARSRAFPGKAVEFLQQLGQWEGEGALTGDDVRALFHQRTGLTTALLDESQPMPRQTVETFFSKRIVGQDHAVTAMIDSVMLTKARLNDPSRPLASLLFLGPTGVGKTECAKALAEFLFSSSERMVRIDMNEFVGIDAAERLVGHPGKPQGILTAAIRRQPYTILLLDEIEKAHAAVFDLLLQVLGDGRLTDYAGNTVDFCNVLIILTSNLGARSSRVPLGFDGTGVDRSDVYLRAAQDFFRPEFFNRLDRVVPFHELTQSHIAIMVRQLVDSALTRRGIRERQLMLKIDDSIYQHVARYGFEPEYGARALRRAVETHLIQPLGQSLAEVTGQSLTAVSLSVSEEGKIQLDQRHFVPVETLSNQTHAWQPQRAQELIGAANAFLQRADDAMEKWQTALDGRDIAARMPYYDLCEDLTQARRLRDRLQHQAELAADPRIDRLTSARRHSPLTVSATRLQGILHQLQRELSVKQFLHDLSQLASSQDKLSGLAEALVGRLSRLAISLDEQEPKPELIKIAWEGDCDRAGGALIRLALSYLKTFPDSRVHGPCENEWESLKEGGEISTGQRIRLIDSITDHQWCLSGIALGRLWASQQGTHLFYNDDDPPAMVSVRAKDVDQLGLRVIRIHHVEGRMLDLATGLIREAPFETLWPSIDKQLPSPREIAKVLGESTSDA